MTLKKHCIAPIAALMLLATACHRQELPDGILEESVMVDFLTDAYLLESTYAVVSGYNYDSIIPEALQTYTTILERHGLTMEQVDSSLDYYAQHPDIYAKIHNRVLDKIKAPQEEKNEAVNDEN